MHWVSAAHALTGQARLYDRLFTRKNPDDVEDGKDFLSYLNDESLEVLDGCRFEPSLAAARAGDRFQFERLGYFCLDEDRSEEGQPIFNRTVTLRDTWAKIEKKKGR